MRKFTVLTALIVLMAIPRGASAVGLEVAVGAWGQIPSGSMSYIGSSMGLKEDFNFDDEIRLSGRIKIDSPFFIPNIYLMATQMEFEGTGYTAFQYGSTTFGSDYDVTLTLDHFDVALFYGLPLLKTATFNKLNLEFGLNARLIEFEGKVVDAATGASETKSISIVVPMLYGGIQVRPIKSVSFEGEMRGSYYEDNKYISALARIKYSPIGPFFLAGGWRGDVMDFSEDDVTADIEFNGPFFELGLEF